MSIWLTLPAGFDAASLLIHARERGVLFVPGRYFYLQNPQPNTLRLGFASVNEKMIARGIQMLGESLKHGTAQAPARRRNEIVRAALRWYEVDDAP